MSAAEENVVYVDNVALVQSYDALDSHLLPPEKDFYDFTGDVSQTVALKVVESRIVESGIESLFGCWIEAGNEDELLEELYKSRLDFE